MKTSLGGFALDFAGLILLQACDNVFHFGFSNGMLVEELLVVDFLKKKILGTSFA